MINNRLTANRRIILSAEHLHFHQQKYKEEFEHLKNMRNESGNFETELSRNEENESYILGYN